MYTIFDKVRIRRFGDIPWSFRVRLGRVDVRISFLVDRSIVDWVRVNKSASAAELFSSANLETTESTTVAHQGNGSSEVNSLVYKVLEIFNASVVCINDRTGGSAIFGIA